MPNKQSKEWKECSLFEVFALSLWYRALFGISLTKTLPCIYIYIYIYIYILYIYIYIYIYIYNIYGSVLVNEMSKSARYHIDRVNSIVFTSKRLPLQPVSSERNHQVADKFRKVSCSNVYSRKRGRVGVKQCMHSFHSLDCLLSVFFDDYMSKLFPIFYLANFVCFDPPVYEIDCFNTDQVTGPSLER